MSLRRDVERKDRHSTKLLSAKVGMLRAADLKRDAGVITTETRDLIRAMIDQAEFADFRPLLYVIPYSHVLDAVEEIPLSERASEYSQEYRLPTLRREQFHVLDLLD
jgi:hypothetical protein